MSESQPNHPEPPKPSTPSPEGSPSLTPAPVENIPATLREAAGPPTAPATKEDTTNAQEAPTAPASTVKAPLKKVGYVGAAAHSKAIVQDVARKGEMLFEDDLSKYTKVRKTPDGTLVSNNREREMDKVKFWGKAQLFLRHPIEFGIRRGIFYNYNLDAAQRHVAHVTSDLKKANITPDRSMHIDVPLELLKVIETEGEKALKSGPRYRRLFNRLTNIVTKPFGIGEYAERRKGREWLRNELKKPANDRNPKLKDFLKQIQTKAEKEYTDKGIGYAAHDESTGLTVEQENKIGRVISTTAGETRHDISDVNSRYYNPELAAKSNTTLKNYIAEYLDILTSSASEEQKKLAKDQLIQKTNTFLRGDFLNSLPSNLRKEFNAPEVSTNILALPNELKDRWKEYKAIGENGHRAWDEYQIKVLFGESEQQAASGEAALSKLQGHLLRKITERDRLGASGAGAATIEGALDYIRDIAPFAIGAYGGRMAATVANSFLRGSAVGAVSNVLLPGVGAIVGKAAVAGLKEKDLTITWFGDKDVMHIKGRYSKELDALSWQRATGYKDDEYNRIRSEMTKHQALIEPEPAQKLIDRLKEAEKIELHSADDVLKVLGINAQIDGRLELSAKSGSKEVGRRVINYVNYGNSNPNAKRNEIRGALFKNNIRIIQVLNQNPQIAEEVFRRAQVKFTDVKNPQNYEELIQHFSEMAQAQLQVGNQEQAIIEQMKARGWDRATATTFVQQTFESYVKEAALAEKKHALKTKLRNQQREQWKRFASASKDSLLVSAELTEIGVATAAVYQEVHHITDAIPTYSKPADDSFETIGNAMAATGEATAKWVRDWGKVINHQMPVHFENGLAVPDVTATMQAYMKFTENWNAQEDFVNYHGFRLILPPGYHHDVIKDESTGHWHVLVEDSANHKMIDLANYEFANTPQGIIVTDKTGVDMTSQFRSQFQDMGINWPPESAKVIDNPNFPQKLDYHVSHSYYEDKHLPGVKIPANTKFVETLNREHYNLVSTDYDGTVLAKNVHIDENGYLVADPDSKFNFHDPAVFSQTGSLKQPTEFIQIYAPPPVEQHHDFPLASDHSSAVEIQKEYVENTSNVHIDYKTNGTPLADFAERTGDVGHTITPDSEYITIKGTHTVEQLAKFYGENDPDVQALKNNEGWFGFQKMGDPEGKLLLVKGNMNGGLQVYLDDKHDNLFVETSKGFITMGELKNFILHRAPDGHFYAQDLPIKEHITTEGMHNPYQNIVNAKHVHELVRTNKVDMNSKEVDDSIWTTTYSEAGQPGEHMPVINHTPLPEHLKVQTLSQPEASAPTEVIISGKDVSNHEAPNKLTVLRFTGHHQTTWEEPRLYDLKDLSIPAIQIGDVTLPEIAAAGFVLPMHTRRNMERPGGVTDGDTSSKAPPEPKKEEAGKKAVITATSTGLIAAPIDGAPKNKQENAENQTAEAHTTAPPQSTNSNQTQKSGINETPPNKDKQELFHISKQEYTQQIDANMKAIQDYPDVKALADEMGIDVAKVEDLRRNPEKLRDYVERLVAQRTARDIVEIEVTQRLSEKALQEALPDDADRQFLVNIASQAAAIKIELDQQQQLKRLAHQQVLTSEQFLAEFESKLKSKIGDAAFDRYKDLQEKVDEKRTAIMGTPTNQRLLQESYNSISEQIYNQLRAWDGKPVT
jgi:hypothetical protein